jgi:hypothetical protein
VPCAWACMWMFIPAPRRVRGLTGLTGLPLPCWKNSSPILYSVPAPLPPAGALEEQRFSGTWWAPGGHLAPGTSYPGPPGHLATGYRLEATGYRLQATVLLLVGTQCVRSPSFPRDPRPRPHWHPPPPVALSRVDIISSPWNLQLRHSLSPLTTSKGKQAVKPLGTLCRIRSHCP